MQILRDISWWVIGLVTTVTFVLVLTLSDLLKGQFIPLQTSAVLIVYICLFLGIANRIVILQLGDTLVHEIGHAQMAALTFGRVRYIRVEKDSSGVTNHFRSRLFGKISTCLVSIFGPISSGVLFLITTRFVASELTQYWAIFLACAVVLILITTVRNLWGWVTGILLLASLYLLLESNGLINPRILGTKNLQTTNQLIVNCILAVTAFNFGNAIRYSFKCRKPRSSNSDEYKFSRSLFLPGVVGGYFILIIQLALLWISLSFILGWSSPLQIGRWI